MPLCSSPDWDAWCAVVTAGLGFGIGLGYRICCVVLWLGCTLTGQSGGAGVEFQFSQRFLDVPASAVAENALTGRRYQHTPKRTSGREADFLAPATLSVCKASHQLLETNLCPLELRCSHTHSDLPERFHWSGGQKGGDAASSLPWIPHPTFTEGPG